MTTIIACRLVGAHIGNRVGSLSKNRLRPFYAILVRRILKSMKALSCRVTGRTSIRRACYVFIQTKVVVPAYAFFQRSDINRIYFQ